MAQQQLDGRTREYHRSCCEKRGQMKTSASAETRTSQQAFNPLIFLRDPKGGHEPQNFCTLLALCARSSISIWVTSQSQPLLVLEDVFDRDILDLSW